jgi:hypothetical protein
MAGTQFGTLAWHIEDGGGWAAFTTFLTNAMEGNPDLRASLRSMAYRAPAWRSQTDPDACTGRAARP